MAWLARGLRDGIVTTRYPRRPDGYGSAFVGAVRVAGRLDPETQPDTDAAGTVAALCPTGAITVDGDRPRLDRGRCILCRRCADARPDLFVLDPVPDVAAVARPALVVPAVPESDAELDRLRSALAARTRALRRSIHIRHVDAGSDGAEEWEIAALTGPIYDVNRLGIYFTASPRHADLLLVTGTGSAGMLDPLRRTWEAMPDPRVVLAAGVDAVSGGLVHPTYATRGGIADILPVDIWVPGAPPSPFALLAGILSAMGRLPAGRAGTASAGRGRP